MYIRISDLDELKEGRKVRFKLKEFNKLYESNETNYYIYDGKKVGVWYSFASVATKDNSDICSFHRRYLSDFQWIEMEVYRVTKDNRSDFEKKVAQTILG